jgi:tRNA nucleotidyltransferase (CCA-adding enzyme)
VRLAALFHDLGKPHVAWRGTDGRLHYYAKHGYSTKSHEQVSADLAAEALARLRYPTELRKRVLRLVRSHMLDTSRADPLRARKLLQRYGEAVLSDLLDHKEADLRGKGDVPPAGELEKLELLRAVVDAQRSSPYRLRDLAIRGDDLIELGFAPGPTLGHALRALLDEVVREPDLNTRDELLRRAREQQR